MSVTIQDDMMAAAGVMPRRQGDAFIVATLVETAQNLPSHAEKGQFYVASLEYLHFGREPMFEMAAPVRTIFECVRPLFALYRGLVAGES